MWRVQLNNIPESSAWQIGTKAAPRVVCLNRRQRFGTSFSLQPALGALARAPSAEATLLT
jgi:hypothetical protein